MKIQQREGLPLTSMRVLDVKLPCVSFTTEFHAPHKTSKLAEMEPSRSHSINDLTIDNITENVNAINSKCNDPRARFLIQRLVTHLHDFARETRLSTGEWETAINFLTQVGQTCTDLRQEFILLSDVLGLSLLVDSIDHPKLPGCTEGTVLGPFHTHDAKPSTIGSVISHDPDGEPMLVVCSVKDRQGRPLSGVRIDVWETDSKGFYDVQYTDRVEPDGRAVLQSAEDGSFHFKAIVPVPYPIPSDGPVGMLLAMMYRHSYRPSHFHFMFNKEGYDRLITALYLRGDPYERSDAVFGVKESLVVDLETVANIDGMAERFNVSPAMRLLRYDFILMSQAEADELRHKLAAEAVQRQGITGVQIINGLPVPDVD